MRFTIYRDVTYNKDIFVKSVHFAIIKINLHLSKKLKEIKDKS